MSYLEQVLKSQDLRFQAALAEAGALYHFGKRGAEFEEDVRGIIQTFLPATYLLTAGARSSACGSVLPAVKIMPAGAFACAMA